MRRILHILPVPVPEAGLAAFRDQLPADVVDPDVEVRFAAPASGAVNMLDSAYERVLADAGVLAVGASAETDGYGAVVINSMSDSAIGALRSRLSIPVVGACQASMAVAALLGHRIGVVTMWPPWHDLYRPSAAAMGLTGRLVSIRDIGVRPDAAELLTGKEDTVFPRLLQECRAAIETDRAEVLILGSTTMHQSHRYLTEHLDVPVINPGVAAHQIAQQLLRAGLSHSRHTYPAPAQPADDLLNTFATGT